MSGEAIAVGKILCWLHKLGLQMLTFLLILQICSSLELGKVLGQLLPRVWASWERRTALVLSHILLPERYGANELPHPSGGQPPTGQHSNAMTQNVRSSYKWNVISRFVNILKTCLQEKRGTAIETDKAAITDFEAMVSFCVQEA